MDSVWELDLMNSINSAHANLYLLNFGSKVFSNRSIFYISLYNNQSIAVCVCVWVGLSQFTQARVHISRS